MQQTADDTREVIQQTANDTKEIIQRTASKLDDVKRLSFLIQSPCVLEAQSSTQLNRCDKTFEGGSRLRILHQITTSHAAFITGPQQPGSFRAVYTRNGSQLLHSYGSMVNVRSSLFALALHPRSPVLIAGSGKTILWFVVYPL